ncbi:hypothetical protein F66182_10458 [Fusarium sp. NRRL 66182]|nr:hypothetical protein F66182_10458 [Fusarium sp. NRRL 66182]
MAFSTLRHLFSHSLLPFTSLARLDKLQMKKKVVRASVSEESVVLHCYLLDHFVSAKASVDSWAAENLTEPEAAWNLYISMGARRLMRWFEASYENHVILDRHIPPLDVLLVWHAFLQDPIAWDAFVNQTKIDFAHWDKSNLLTTLYNGPDKFGPPFDSMDVINNLYDLYDARSIMDLSISRLFSRPDETASDETALEAMQLVYTIRTPKRQLSFKFDFHHAVRCQLVLAERVTNFSWHRMYAQPNESKQEFKSAVERYSRFMTLRQFQRCIQRLIQDAGEMCFTPLDIDLVWRTHMLEPRSYRWFCSGIFGALIHNIPSHPADCEGETTLDATSQIYEYVFGEEYVLCLCWPCVNGRNLDAQGIPRRKWFSTTKTRVPEEMYRLRAAYVNIPLKVASKKCWECGTHPRRSCREKHIARRPSIDLSSPCRRPVSTRAPARTGPIYPSPMLPMPWSEVILAPPRAASVSAQRSAVPTPAPARSLGSSSIVETRESTPGERDDELYDADRSRCVTPGLTIASTHSNGSHDGNGPGNYTLRASLNRYQIPPMGRTFTPRANNRNATGTRSSPDVQDRAGDPTGPEPGEWLAG